MEREDAMNGTNVLLVLLDDHAQWAAHCYGNSELRTPTLDYLADTGVKMENAFTPTPVCSPGRAALLTGRIASQHGIHDFLGGEYETRDGRPWLEDERTLAQILSDAGYVVGLSGKWHLGGSSEKQPGFDYWYQEAKYSPDRGHTALQRSALAWPHPWPGAPDSSRDPGVHTITDYAIDFLRTRDRQRPFFLIAGYIATHSPWIGHPERLVSAYRRCTFRDVPPDAMYPYGRPALESRFPSRQRPFEALAQYYAAVSVIDEQVGRLIDELDAQGCRSNTLVVYTSDHGLNMGHHGVWGKGNGTRPLNMLDESIRIPLIFNHPDTIFGGQVRNEMVTHCDTFQTILDHIGVTISDSERTARRYPGRSYRPLLIGDAVPEWTQVVFGEYGSVRMVRTQRHKVIRHYPGPTYLFDLVADPRERENLSDRPETQPLIADLTQMLERFFADHEDERKSGLRVRDLPHHNGREAWRQDDL